MSQTYPTRFIVLCHGRTGGTLLGSILASHPAIAWGGEEFYLGVRRGALNQPFRFLVQRWPLLRLNWLAGRHDAPVYGCKLAPKYVRSISHTVAQVHRRGWLIIHLQRRNTFQEAISGLVAHDTGHYQRFADQAPPTSSAPQLAFTPARLLNRMQFCTNLAVKEQQALAGVPHLQVYYEDDLVNPDHWEATAGRVFAALGLAPAPLQPNVKKTWDRPYAEIITNYTELVEAARAAGYGQFLDRLS